MSKRILGEIAHDVTLYFGGRIKYEERIEAGSKFAHRAVKFDQKWNEANRYFFEYLLEHEEFDTHPGIDVAKLKEEIRLTVVLSYRNYFNAMLVKVGVE